MKLGETHVDKFGFILQTAENSHLVPRREPLMKRICSGCGRAFNSERYSHHCPYCASQNEVNADLSSVCHELEQRILSGVMDLLVEAGLLEESDDD